MKPKKEDPLVTQRQRKKVKRKAFGHQQIQRVATLSFSFLGKLKKKEEIKMRNGRRGQKKGEQ